MKTLSKRQILSLHDHLIAETGGQAGLRDDGLLESALAAPFAAFGSEELYPTLVQKAARLGYGLVKNHAFIDGNKRIAAHATLVFLAVNGVELRYTQQELSDIFLKLAADEARYEDLLVWIKEHDA
ncbi:MAG TPA: type II toxin-antitoxin system death-on-curing family toxin [Candidatus Caccocola faecipullorum]|nr:type II toxin-antitoxin system death-on-curing family toxin [Candidatus Caccocola faecipullorum]